MSAHILQINGCTAVLSISILSTYNYLEVGSSAPYAQKELCNRVCFEIAQKELCSAGFPSTRSWWGLMSSYGAYQLFEKHCYAATTPTLLHRSGKKYFSSATSILLPKVRTWYNSKHHLSSPPTKIFFLAPTCCAPPPTFFFLISSKYCCRWRLRCQID